MLTVRVIRPDGSEFVEEVTSVGLNTAEQSQSGRKSISYFLPDKEIGVGVFEGMVYVMNQNGKTVASYFLGNPPKPQE